MANIANAQPHAAKEHHRARLGRSFPKIEIIALPAIE
jgi:hypothetical protein